MRENKLVDNICIRYWQYCKDFGLKTVGGIKK